MNNSFIEDDDYSTHEGELKAGFTSKLGPIEIIALIQLLLVFIIGTFGNGFVIHHFGWIKRKQRKPFSLLLLILGITDFLASMFVPTLFIYGTITQYREWHFGYYGCKIIQSFFPVTVTMSSCILVLISFERYRVISNPFCKNLRRRYICIWLLSSLVIAIVLVIPYTFSVSLVMDHELHIYTCIPEDGNSTYLFLYVIGNFTRDVVATLIMVKFGLMSNNALKGNDTLMESKTVKRRLSHASKARKMLLVVVLAFSSCIIPLDFFQLSIYSLFQTNYNPSKEQYASLVVTNTFLTILQVSNSATNVLIYSKMQKDFIKPLPTSCSSPPSDKLKHDVTLIEKVDDVFEFDPLVFAEV